MINLIKKYKYFSVLYLILGVPMALYYLRVAPIPARLIITVPVGDNLSSFSHIIQSDFQSDALTNVLLRMQSYSEPDIKEISQKGNFHRDNYIKFNNYHGNTEALLFMFEVSDLTEKNRALFINRFEEEFLPVFSRYENYKLQAIYDMSKASSTEEFKRLKSNLSEFENKYLNESMFSEEGISFSEKALTNRIVPFVISADYKKKNLFTIKNILTIVLFFCLSLLPILVYWETLIASKK